MRQAEAVEARIALDLRIGAAFTRLQTMGLQHRIPELADKVMSYGTSRLRYELIPGPCQFPTLGFVVDQYKRVQEFVPEPFWFIYVSQEREEGEVVFRWRRNHLFDMEVAIELYAQCIENPVATVTKVETKPTTKW